MASIAVHTSGYRGDVLPFVSIARELTRRGHMVSFVCPEGFDSTLASEPFTVVSSRVLPSPVELDRHAAFVARWGTRLGGVYLPRLYFDRIVLPRIDEIYDEAAAMCERADLVVSHPWSHLIVGPAAERQGVPTVVGDVFPMLVPSESMPPPGQRSMGRLGNRMAWAMLHAPLINRLWFMGSFRRLRQRLDLSVDGWSLFAARLSPTLNLGLFSSLYQPHLPGWPANYAVVGFCPWTPDAVGLAPDVERFLAGGGPPVLVTFGSNAAAAHPEVFVATARALDAHGVRGVFLTSNPDVTDLVRDRIDGVHGVWQFVPVEPLLERCRAVVHAGGLGTVASTLRAGLPAAIRPAVTDQIWHAQRCESMGVGVQVGHHIERAVARLLDDKSLAERAATLGAKLRLEDGPSLAADHIENALPA